MSEWLLDLNKSRTKGRFQVDFGKKEYLDLPMCEAKEIMKIRLNMTETKANFKGKYNDLTCPACMKENETTEHLICCPVYKRITGHSLNTNKPVIELFNNTAWLRETNKVFKMIDTARKFLI